MLIHLIKKDFLIVKKYVLIVLAVCVIFPIFLIWRLPEYAGVMGYILTTIFSIFMLLQYVSLKESQYPKASTLLCATPYPRKMLVLAKYAFCLIVFCACSFIFWIETLFLPQLGVFHFEMLVMMLLVMSVFLGIYLPVQYKLGYEKTKFFFGVIIMGSPFILPLLLKLENRLNIDFINMFNSRTLYSGGLLISLAIFVISVFASIKIYNKADLA
nr:ABC-2 transporter permease [Clostridioides difficile]